MGAIARRSLVNESVADALADTDDDEAIADLLSNPSAQLREETLDGLIDRAESVELWHAPLAGRPNLPRGAAVRLANFLADNLIDVLKQRQDLDAETLEAVKSVGTGEKDQVRKAAHETLEILARDQLTRVRQILAEALKDVADAPPDIIKGLALDEELVVSGPVLEFSPVLTDDDLLEIIEKGPAKGGLGTIARPAL